MPKRSTTAEFIKKAKRIHKNKYKYSKVEYKNNHTKVCIVCPKHGEFWQTPHNHLSGNNCPKCTNVKKHESQKHSIEDFIKRANFTHNNKYDYSKTEYVNTKTKVCIICHEKDKFGKEHGEFWQSPISHINGTKCPKCSNTYRLTTDDFINQGNLIHNNKYNYSKANYINAKTNVKIICPIHGEFEQSPKLHLAGSGCPKCSREKIALNQTLNTEDFVNKATLIHGDKYDYSKSKYISGRSKLIITCLTHGDFEQNAYSHLRGSGCPKCSVERISKTQRSTTEEFIKKAKNIHGDRYDYSKVKYEGSKKEVCIICNKHGAFWQIPNTHLMNHGCPKCAKRTSQVNFYNKLKESLNLEFIFDAHVDWLGMQSLDIYNSEYNFAIEFNGIQHYQPIEFFGGEEYYNKICELDKLKSEKCLSNNCKLWNIRWDYSEDDYNTLITEINNYVNSKK